MLDRIMPGWEHGNPPGWPLVRQVIVLWTGVVRRDCATLDDLAAGVRRPSRLTVGDRSHTPDGIGDILYTSGDDRTTQRRDANPQRRPAQCLCLRPDPGIRGRPPVRVLDALLPHVRVHRGPFGGYHDGRRRDHPAAAVLGQRVFRRCGALRRDRHTLRAHDDGGASRIPGPRGNRPPSCVFACLCAAATSLWIWEAMRGARHDGDPPTGCDGRAGRRGGDRALDCASGRLRAASDGRGGRVSRRPGMRSAAAGCPTRSPVRDLKGRHGKADSVSWSRGDDRLLGHPGRRGTVAGRRVAFLRRHRTRACRWLCPAHRPDE